MERLLERSVQYAKQRRQFGQPIAKFQMVANKIVDMRMRLESSKSWLYKVAWLKHSGKSAHLESAMAKLHISEAWIQNSLDGMQIHGGYGYLTETGIERELRDSIASRFFSGTSEIQRQIIAQLIGL